MHQPYYTLDSLLAFIDEPNQHCCRNLYSDNKKMFDEAKGSRMKHQAWSGGYIGHVTECMNIAIRLHQNLTECRELPFSVSDALLVLFLHDLEKPWKYAGNEEQKKIFFQFSDYQEFILNKVAQYGFELTDAHHNALKYVHGEGDDYDPKTRVNNELAAFIHCCDTISARIWYDYPKSPSW